MYKTRPKKVLGTAATLGIAAGANLLIKGIGSIFGHSARKKAQRLQQINQNKADTYAMANNLSSAYGTQDYVDDFQDRVEFKNGGTKKRKFEGGGSVDWAQLGANAAGSILDGILANKEAKWQIKSTPTNIINNRKTNIKPTDYDANNFTTYNNRLRMVRLGGRKCR